MSLEVMYERCAGIDVHQRFVVVCVIVVEGGKRRQEIRTFRNETADLLALRAWLVQERCTHVGMESTGVYWMQVYRRLEGYFELVVANAQQIKAVRGAKNGRAGCRMDRQFAATRTLQPQFCAQPGTARPAGSDPAAREPGRGTHPPGQSGA
jgi:transposase